LARIRRQREIIARIESVGGKCHYQHEDIRVWEYFDWPYANGSNRTPLDPKWLRRILGEDAFSYVTFVSFEDHEATIPRDVFALLPHLPELQYLAVRPRVDDESFVHITGIRKLRYLLVDQVQLTPTGCSALQHAKAIEELEISGQMGDGPKHLASLPRLRALKLEVYDLTDDDLKELARCPSLEAVWLGSCTCVTPDGVPALCALPNLKLLEFLDAPITDKEAAELPKLTRLRVLRIMDSSYLTDQGLRHLHSMTWLEELWVHGDEITREGGTALIAALPDCEISTPYVSQLRGRNVRIREQGPNH
jgi:hypothetical protein